MSFSGSGDAKVSTSSVAPAAGVIGNPRPQIVGVARQRVDVDEAVVPAPRSPGRRREAGRSRPPPPLRRSRYPSAWQPSLPAIARKVSNRRSASRRSFALIWVRAWLRSGPAMQGTYWDDRRGNLPGRLWPHPPPSARAHGSQSSAGTCWRSSARRRSRPSAARHPRPWPPREWACPTAAAGIPAARRRSKNTDPACVTLSLRSMPRAMATASRTAPSGLS